MNEKAEQSTLFKWAEIAGNQYPELALLFAIPNAGGFTGGYKKNMLRVMSMRREGVKKGVPDLFLPVPRGKYHGLFIEMKTEKGKASIEQKHWINRLSEQGFWCEVCPGFEAAKQTIERYLG